MSQAFSHAVTVSLSQMYLIIRVTALMPPRSLKADSSQKYTQPGHHVPLGPRPSKPQTQTPPCTHTHTHAHTLRSLALTYQLMTYRKTKKRANIPPPMVLVSRCRPEPPQTACCPRSEAECVKQGCRKMSPFLHPYV